MYNKENEYWNLFNILIKPVCRNSVTNVLYCYCYHKSVWTRRADRWSDWWMDTPKTIEFDQYLCVEPFSAITIIWFIAKIYCILGRLIWCVHNHLNIWSYDQTMLYLRSVARRRPGTLCFNIIWASMRETLILLLVNKNGADQPVHTHNLTSAFVIRYL